MAVLKIERRSLIIYFDKGRMNGYLKRYGTITYFSRRRGYLVLSYNSKYENKIKKLLDVHKDCTGYEDSLFDYPAFDMELDIRAID